MTVGTGALIVVMLLANAMFVAFEFSLVACRRTQLEQAAAAGSRRAAVAIAALGSLGRQIAGVQLGVTIASLGLGAVAEPAMADLIDHLLRHGLSRQASAVVGFALGLALVVFAHTVVGELVPKSLAIAKAERTLLALATPMRLFLIVFGPIVTVLDGTAGLVLGLLGVERRHEVMVAGTAQELALLFRQSTEEGLIEARQGELLAGTFELSRPISEVMVPRDAIDAVTITTSVDEVARTALRTGHTRLPIQRRGADDVVGYVHVKDLLGVAEPSAPLTPGLIRRLLLVRDELACGEVLLAMQRARQHIALVRDRDGRTAGLVTLEDVLEELVGQITDETDR
jgi:CBS domain containing-hemolysin-like protein